MKPSPPHRSISTSSTPGRKPTPREKLLGDRGYVSNWIVLEFVDPDLTEEQKTWFKQGPDDTNAW